MTISTIILCAMAVLAGFQVVELLMDFGETIGIDQWYRRKFSFKPFSCDYCMGHWIGLAIMALVYYQVPGFATFAIWLGAARIAVYLTRDQVPWDENWTDQEE